MTDDGHRTAGGLAGPPTFPPEIVPEACAHFVRDYVRGHLCMSISARLSLRCDACALDMAFCELRLPIWWPCCPRRAIVPGSPRCGIQPVAGRGD